MIPNYTSKVLWQLFTCMYLDLGCSKYSTFTLIYSICLDLVFSISIQCMQSKPEYNKQTTYYAHNSPPQIEISVCVTPRIWFSFTGWECCFAFLGLTCRSTFKRSKTQWILCSITSLPPLHMVSTELQPQTISRNKQ